MKANFIGIGPGKSGTTWLYLTLQKHPQIVTSKVKETNFFIDQYFRGEKWYHELFEFEPNKIAGEISNTYIFSAEAAERIFNYNSKMKLISILRDPIERAVSHYLFLVRNGANFKSFDEALSARPDLLQRGLYYHHLQPYLSRFPKGQIFIGIFDDLKADSQVFTNALLKFLEVDLVAINTHATDTLKASKPRNRYLSLAVKTLANLVRASGNPILVERIKRMNLANKLYERMDYDVGAIISSSKTFLLDYYAEDIECCSNLVDRDLRSIWMSKYNG